MKSKVLIIGFVIALLWQCGTPKKSQNATVSISVMEPTVIGTEEVEVDYKETSPTLWRLIHIDAKIHPVFKTQDLYGEATLTLVTHFYPMDSLWLDARGFIIDTIEVISPQNISFNYTYDGRHIKFVFQKTFYKDDTLVLKIRYRNNFSPVDSSGKAVAGDRGFYFVNPTGADPIMPPHAWTQGETEWNSWWLPLIDKPNQHLTQHICITVDDTTFVTLSNGTLQWTQTNPDGTRTDCWAQDKPHAAYLIFVAVGPFKILEDSAWNGKPVNYYLFPRYVPLAKRIFPNTREMLTYFSKLLKYPFPWDKYSQIGVYHFTAGAMENTTSVLFGAGAYKTETDLMESSIEPVVAHELIHHWFGDLVSCESWAHLTLNESFADYGEYLWAEYKYGRDSADVARERSLWGYIWSAKYGYTRPLVFFHYDQGDDMFDAHSYNKGGAILHYLRYLAGDSAFFSSLTHYLKMREYGSAEAEHLRLAFEDITGIDWRPFFMQWYYKEGHPVLTVAYNIEQDSLVIQIKQETVPEDIDPWTLELPLLFKTTNGTEIRNVIITDTLTELKFPIDQDIRYAILDPNYVLVGEISHDMPFTWKEKIIRDFDLPAIARRQIIRSISDEEFANLDSTQQTRLVRSLLSDPFYHNRVVALRKSNSLVQKHSLAREFFLDTLINIAMSDQSFQVRARSVALIPSVSKELAKKMFHEEKYPSVKAEWLEKWTKQDTLGAWNALKEWCYRDTSRSVWEGVLPIVSDYFYSQPDVFDWLTDGLWLFAHDYWIWTWFSQYLRTLIKTQNAELVKRGIDTLKTLTEVRIHPWNRMAMKSFKERFINDIDDHFAEEADTIKNYLFRAFPYLRDD